jgi:hypothetical protein
MSISIRPLKAPGNGSYLWQDEDVDVNNMFSGDILAFDTSITTSVSNGVTGAWVNKRLSLNNVVANGPPNTIGGLTITNNGDLAFSLSLDNSVIRTSATGGSQVINGNLTITGDVTVNGTTNVTTRDVTTGENIILLNALMPPTDPPLPTGGGIYVYRGDSAFTTGIVWSETEGEWVVNNRSGVTPNEPNFPTVGGGVSEDVFTIWHSGNDGAGSGLDADTLDGNSSVFFQNANNLTAGTVPAARLTGTYAISISGNAVTATRLQLPVNINGVPFDGSTDITILDNTKLPIQGGVMTGNYSHDISPTTTGVTVIKRPAVFTSNTATNVGAIKIVLPVGWSGTMMRIRIVGYNHTSTTGGWELTVAGQNDSATNSWINCNAISSGDLPFGSVTFGFDNSTGRVCLLLGEVTTDLAYPKIVVEEAMVGFSNVSSAIWRTGWSIVRTTDVSDVSSVVIPLLKTITDFGYTVVGSNTAVEARAALNVYSTAETFNRSETYSKAEVDALVASVARDAMPLFSVQWWPSRSAIPVGFVTADGQLLSRTTYADAWSGIAAGKVPSTADGTWTGSQIYRGMYTPGNGSTNFRIPDYNGVTGGALGALFLRGDGGNSAGTSGVIQADALQNITGSAQVSNNIFRGTTTGANFYTGWNAGHSVGGVNGVYTGTQINFDASLVARTANETRPLNVTGCWIVKIQGTITGTYAPLPVTPGNYDFYVPPVRQIKNNASSAQVKFNGITVDILDSQNISSVTNLGTGKYRISFTKMDTDSYYVVPTLTSAQYTTVLISDITADGFTIDVVNNESEHVDISTINIAVIGGNDVD